MVNKIKLMGILLISFFSCTSMAYASGLTFGAKTGPMMYDVSGVDDPVNAGIAVGSEMGIVLGDVGVEGEFTTTMNKGSVGSSDLSIDTMALYATYRSPGFLYFKARGGFLRWDQKVGSSSDNDTTTSLGLGLGFSLAVVKVELEYTQIDKDINFLSVGVQF